VTPEIDYTVFPPRVSFVAKTGNGQPISGTVNRRGAVCVACGVPVSFDHIRTEGKSGRMHPQLFAVVAEYRHIRVYLSPNEEHLTAVKKAAPTWKPDVELPHNPRDFKTPNYGMCTFADLFTSRQLELLTNLFDLVKEAREAVISDALAAGMLSDGISLNEGGDQTDAYADSIATYLAEAVSKLTMFHNKLAYWRSKENKSATGLGRQALPMVWDFAEVNPFAGAGGDFLEIITKTVPKVLSQALPATPRGSASLRSADAKIDYPLHPIISTDPPYYDNISYADLSDFYYVWLRRSLNKIFPDLFSTLLTPKAQELVATPYRFGGDKARSQKFFEEGLFQAFSRMRDVQHSDYPLTVYYAFKQAESEVDVEVDENDQIANKDAPIAIASTGWEAMLEGLIKTGFTITGTWPMRTEMSSRMIGKGTNALASSIVLVCRPRPIDASTISRRQFLNELKLELPLALKQMQHGSIAPVDLAQASIGPGMAIYSRYSKVIEADGTPIRVRTALQLINRALDEVLAEQEGESDVDTRWAIAWFETHAMDEGPYGQAETLSKAKNTAIQTLVDAGILEARAGKVRLLRPEEFSEKWQPEANPHVTAWEVMQRAIHALDKHGEVAAGNVLGKAGDLAEVVRDLAYRLYTICERKGWSQEAQAYNRLLAE